MDCVGCDKCRLWGKVQTTGIATALKVLFELDAKALEYVSCASNVINLTILDSPASNSNLLSRSEVVALINTLHRFSESLNAVGDFRKMWADAQAAEKATPRVSRFLIFASCHLTPLAVTTLAFGRYP
jgi:ERO1-like protein beta